MRGAVKLCKRCGLERHHNRRADCSTLRSVCRDCDRAYMKHWRLSKWQRRKLYDTWRGMLRRCYDRSTTRWWPGTGVPSYRDYGALGIRVCERWRGGIDGFYRFAQDMGAPPTKHHTLDRRNNLRGYTPSNCRWATKAEQDSNRRNAVWIEAHHPVTGELKRQTIAGWARETGLSRWTISRRLRRGLAKDEAVRPLEQPAGVPF